MNYLKSFWKSLPHAMQGGLVAFGSAAGATLIDLLTSSQSLCLSASCLKHSGLLALGAGLAALRAFYMKPNKPQ